MVGTVWISDCDSGQRGVHRPREEEVESAVVQKPQPSSPHQSLLAEPSLAALLLLSLPPPLRSSPHPSLPPLCFWGSWTKEATQCSRLCGSRKTLLLSAWQTINTFTVLTGKSQTTTVLFGHSGNDRKALNVVHAHTHTRYSKMIFQGSKDSYWALLADFTDVCLTICRWCILFAPDGFLTAYINRFETAANMTVMLRYLVHLFLFSSGSSYVRHTCKPAQ